MTRSFRSMPPFTWLPLLLLALCCQTCVAQLQVHSVSPVDWTIGAKNRVTFTGKGMSDEIRLLFTEKLQCKVLASTSEKLEVEIDVPPGMPPTEAGVWLSSKSAVSSAHHVILDTLPYASETGTDNHLFENAIAVSFPSVIEGKTEASHTDFYRFYAFEGDLLFIDVLAQRLGSNMDSYVKLYDPDRKQIASVDDTELGPDSQCHVAIEKSGWYTLAVRDSRFLGGGNYLVRLSPAYDDQTISPLLAHRSPKDGLELSDPKGTPHWILPSSNPFAFPSIVYQSSTSVLDETDTSLKSNSPAAPKPPFTLVGHLQLDSEQDSFWFQAEKGKTLRIATQTRSLGSPALLRAELWKEGMTKVAESPVQDQDEWILEFPVTETGTYQLRVNDLLRRGGPNYGYAIEIKWKNDFDVVWKVDPKGTEARLADVKAGAIAVDLVVQRQGYEGPIEIRCEEPAGWRVLNPRIEAKQVGARCYVQAATDWEAGEVQWLRFVASPVSQEASGSDLPAAKVVSNLSWLRAKHPNQPYPARWKQHRGVVLTTAASDAPASARAPDVSRRSRESEALEWKIALAALQGSLPAGAEFPAMEIANHWTVKGSVNKEHVHLSLARTSTADKSTADKVYPESFSVPFYYETQGIGRLGTFELPMEWYDSPERVEFFPQRIAVHRSRDHQRLSLSGWDSSGMVRDWSDYVEWTVSDPKLGEVKGGIFYPKDSGAGTVTGKLGKHSIRVPVTVELSGKTASVEFENEVLVALSKQGCNSGACHGSPSGKGGFRLSLRAFDKELDSLTLVNEYAARRVNTLEPDESLLIKKALMKVSHGGGMQLKKGEAAYRVLHDWIAGGAKLDPPDAARCVKLEVYPNDARTLPLQTGQQKLIVMAHFANGTSRDVTDLVSYESSSSTVATVSKQGIVTPKSQGETVILVRFLEHIESIPFVFIDSQPEFQWVKQPELNWIDGLVDTKLERFQINASPVCDDATFLRRSSLDVIGQLPTPSETREFLASTDPGKRSKWIDQLLDRPEYASFWALKWGDLLRVTTKGVTEEGVYKYHRWIEEAFAANKPYDQFARELLLSKGSTFLHPEANFYRTAKDAQESVETVSQLFLGARLQCAKCHNHPFERWTQDNYYGLSAFFNRVQRKNTTRPNELWIWTSAQGEIQQPRTGKIMAPWVPGELAALAADADRRQAFVEWLVNPENPYFARVEANRIWSQLFARGIVDPIDDFRDSNPPTNKPLLDGLSQFFVEQGYNRKALLRVILNSRTYQADFATHPSNEEDALYFSHQEPRLLSAEPLLDAVNHLLGTEQRFGVLPEGTKATQLPAPDVAKLEFLRVFGQPERSTVCACERLDESNLGMAIELFNGSFLYEKLRAPENRFRRMLHSGSDLKAIIQELYLAGFCREPSEEELQRCVAHCQSKDSLEAGLEDLCWVLLNTDEFLFQH
ncbi:Bacterial Ig-like domain (group 2) [Pirellula sp. SH-Sr6A]|uniref:DUF1549 and DUF1553 domain-containing protein n=1 Tax=Pirellula sp. SH-Sr6A TaxID=1632865 RepID=UPI00078CC12C|nr:DUF1549 and DUF1553 domain-containing protein [Pirellula sp. SH-Sr6A]AMV34922.1 Bacterial Ig-like domain (group 2) [Pirellula sp. SH-Sr6A]